MKLVCLGDSFTASPMLGPSKGWPSLLQESLAIDVIGRGISGAPIPCVPSMVPEGWRSFYDFTGLNRQLAELNEWTRSFSHVFLCARMDVFTPVMEALEEPAFAEKTYLDGLHLSEAGHRFLAGLMQPQLERILR